MPDVTVTLPSQQAEEIRRRAAALGTTPERWLSFMVGDLLADLPPDREGPDSAISR
jgi:hypothetical protein